MLGARMAERESQTQMGEGQKAARKGGKGKGVIKRSKAAPKQQEPQVEGRRTAPGEPVPEGRELQDQHLVAKIQQRAYLLFEARGFEHGHDLEHWLEAERQILGIGASGEIHE